MQRPVQKEQCSEYVEGRSASFGSLASQSCSALNKALLASLEWVESSARTARGSLASPVGPLLICFTAAAFAPCLCLQRRSKQPSCFTWLRCTRSLRSTHDFLAPNCRKK